MASILVSRFLLDLQEVHQGLANPQLSSLSSAKAGSPIFQRVIGSLGSTLSLEFLGGTAPEAANDPLALATGISVVGADGAGQEADVVEEVPQVQDA